MNEIWNAKREQLEKSVVEVMLDLFEHSGGAGAIKLSIPNTSPQVFIVAGDNSRIRSLMALDEAACPNCLGGWTCEKHPGVPWPHGDCAGPGTPCRNDKCINHWRFIAGEAEGQLAALQSSLDEANGKVMEWEFRAAHSECRYQSHSNIWFCKGSTEPDRHSWRRERWTQEAKAVRENKP